MILQDVRRKLSNAMMALVYLELPYATDDGNVLTAATKLVVTKALLVTQNQ